MSSIEIKKVVSRRDLASFVDFHYDLYKGNEYDAPNLFSDEMMTLDPKRNAAFDFCEAQCFLALREGKTVGRVAAIINRKANERWGRRTVRFGWIDFVDDLEVSRALLDAVEQWGRERGMTEVVGPLGFTDFDPEGMLTYGFDELNTMATIYNYPYYAEHMERLGGWEKDNDYVEYKVYVPQEVPERLKKIAGMVEKRYNLRARSITKADLRQGMGLRVFHLINETFKNIYGFSELSDRQINQYLDMYLRWADLRLIVVVEDMNADGRLVGVGISLPSLSRAVQKCRRGRLLPLGWWHLIRALWFHKTRYVDLEMVGVLPEYRSKGANALLFAHLIPIYQEYGFEWGETQVEMETNENVQSQWQFFKTEQHKRRRCYVKQIGLSEEEKK